MLYAIVVYLTCNWFSDDFVIIFVLLTLLLTIDFWWTKNVSGRLLVGLRYWNEVDESTGESKWQFESRDAEGMRLVDATEKRIFWWTIYGAPLVWVLFLTTSLTKLNFNYALVCLMAVGMLMTNTLGYMKCSKDQESNSRVSSERRVVFHHAARLPLVDEENKKFVVINSSTKVGLLTNLLSSRPNFRRFVPFRYRRDYGTVRLRGGYVHVVVEFVICSVW